MPCLMYTVQVCVLGCLCRISMVVAAHWRLRYDALPTITTGSVLQRLGISYSTHTHIHTHTHVHTLECIHTLALCVAVNLICSLF